VCEKFAKNVTFISGADRPIHPQQQGMQQDLTGATK